MLSVAKMDLMMAEVAKMKAHIVSRYSGTSFGITLCWELALEHTARMLFLIKYTHCPNAFFSRNPSLTEAADANIAQDEIGVLCWCDFNVPYARGSNACTALCKGMATLNDMAPKLTCAVLTLPDNPRESSLRGLYDEEKQIHDELHALAQFCDTRWIDLWARESRKADLRSSARKFGAGRMVISHAAQEDNAWLASELAICGRVVGSNEISDGVPVAVLPRTASILIPESSSPDP